MKPISNKIKFMSIVVILAFMGQECAMAAPGLLSPVASPQNSFQALDIGQVIQSPELLEVASEFASLKEFHSGFNQKLIVLIEDAHANYSGQMNLAKTLDGLMSKYPIEQVLVEGGSGDVSLTPLRQIATPKVWNQVAKKFLLEAKLSGEEYLNLTSEHPMQLLGIEDEALYDQALNHYAALVDSRKDSLKYLHRIQIAIQKIKNQTFPKNLLQYEDFKSAHADDSNKQIDKLIELAREAKVSLTAFPALTALKSLKVIEAQIDFDQANLEQAKLMQVLSQSMPPNVFGELNALSPKSTHSREASYAFMAQLFENVVKYRLDIDDYKMLLQYSQYLNKSLRLDLGQILNETKSLEDAVYNANLTGENQLKLRQVDRFAIALRKAYNVQMDSTDFADYEAFLQQVPIYAWIAFLNRQLLDLNSFDEVIAYEEDLEESTLAINQFYESVGQRDEQFVRQTKAYLNESQAAFMIVGGYHTQNLTHLLRQAGFSYAVLTPNIDHETDHNLYESILLSEIPDIPSSNVQPNQSLRDAQKDLSLRGAERRGNLESNPLATIRTQTLATSSNRLNQLLASIGLAAPRMIAIKSELTQQVDESRLTLKRQTNKQAEPSAKEIKSSRMANRRLVKINAVLEHFADLPTVHPGLVSWILMALDAKHLDAPTVTVKRLISEVSTALDLYYQTMLDTKLSKDIRMTFLNPRLDLSPELAAKVKHTELFVAIEDARMIHDIQQLFESNDFKNKDLDLIQTHSAFQSPVDPAVPIEGVATPISMGIFEVTQNEAPINKETQTFIEEKIKTLKERREAMQLTEVTSSGKANLPFRFIEGDIAVWENLSVGADFANNIIPWYLRDSDDPHAISEIKAVVEEDQNEFLAVINGLIDDVVKNVLLEVEETTDDESTTKKKKYVWTPNQLQYLVDLRDRALTELWNQSQLRHDRIRLSALSVTRELLADDVKRLDKHNDFGLEEDQLIHIAKYFRRALRQTFYLRTRKEIDQNKENLKTALDPILKIKSPEQKIQSFVLLFELNIYPMMLAMVEGKPFVADFKSAAGALKANGFDITNFHGINIQALEGQPVSGKFVLDIFMKLLPEVFLQMGLYVQQGRDESGAAEIESILKRTIDVYEKLIQKGEATDKHAGIKKIPGEDVILATNILDPFTIVELLKHGNIAAILTNEGTVSSHFAVVAKTYGVPVFILDKVDGQKFDVTNRDLAGRKVLIETSNKKVLINPSSDSQKEFDEQRDKFQLYEDVAKHHAQKTAIPNRNGARAISVMANAEEVDQIQEAMASGAEGVALSRTELLYSNRDNPALEKYVHAYEYLQSLSPGSDVYREAQATLTSDREQLVKFFETNFTEKANATSQGNLTLRTYDLEPDKEADVPNPTKVFGVDYYRTTRGRELLKIELEGKIRANALSARGNIKILFPMYRSNAEFAKRAKDPKSLTPEDIALFQKMMREDIDLVEEIYLEAVERVKQTFDKPLKSIKLGAMIENQYMIKGPDGYDDSVMRYILIKKGFDFFSIGTNDLTRSLFNANRDSEEQADKFDELQPGLLEALTFIYESVDQINQELESDGKSKATCSICGEHAGWHSIALFSDALAHLKDLKHVVVELGLPAVEVARQRHFIRGIQPKHTAFLRGEEELPDGVELEEFAFDKVYSVIEAQMVSDEYLKAIEEIELKKSAISRQEIRWSMDPKLPSQVVSYQLGDLSDDEIVEQLHIALETVSGEFEVSNRTIDTQVSWIRIGLAGEDGEAVDLIALKDDQNIVSLIELREALETLNIIGDKKTKQADQIIFEFMGRAEAIEAIRGFFESDEIGHRGDPVVLLFSSPNVISARMSVTEKSESNLKTFVQAIWQWGGGTTLNILAGASALVGFGLLSPMGEEVINNRDWRVPVALSLIVLGGTRVFELVDSLRRPPVTKNWNEVVQAFKNWWNNEEPVISIAPQQTGAESEEAEDELAGRLQDSVILAVERIINSIDGTDKTPEAPNAKAVRRVVAKVLNDARGLRKLTDTANGSVLAFRPGMVNIKETMRLVDGVGDEELRGWQMFGDAEHFFDAQIDLYPLFADPFTTLSADRNTGSRSLLQNLDPDKSYLEEKYETFINALGALRDIDTAIFALVQTEKKSLQSEAEDLDEFFDGIVDLLNTIDSPSAADAVREIPKAIERFNPSLIDINLIRTYLEARKAMNNFIGERITVFIDEFIKERDLIEELADGKTYVSAEYQPYLDQLNDLKGDLEYNAKFINELLSQLNTQTDQTDNELSRRAARMAPFKPEDKNKTLSAFKKEFGVHWEAAVRFLAGRSADQMDTSLYDTSYSESDIEKDRNIEIEVETANGEQQVVDVLFKKSLLNFKLTNIDFGLKKEGDKSPLQPGTDYVVKRFANADGISSELFKTLVLPTVQAESKVINEYNTERFGWNKDSSLVLDYPNEIILIQLVDFGGIPLLNRPQFGGLDDLDFTALGREIAEMHNQGIYHPGILDSAGRLNYSNIFLGDSGRAPFDPDLAQVFFEDFGFATKVESDSPLLAKQFRSILRSIENEFDSNFDIITGFENGYKTIRSRMTDLAKAKQWTTNVLVLDQLSKKGKKLMELFAKGVTRFKSGSPYVLDVNNGVVVFEVKTNSSQAKSIAIFNGLDTTNTVDEWAITAQSPMNRVDDIDFAVPEPEASIGDVLASEIREEALKHEESRTRLLATILNRRLTSSRDEDVEKIALDIRLDNYELSGTPAYYEENIRQIIDVLDVIRSQGVEIRIKLSASNASLIKRATDLGLEPSATINGLTSMQLTDIDHLDTSNLGDEAGYLPLEQPQVGSSGLMPVLPIRSTLYLAVLLATRTEKIDKHDPIVNIARALAGDSKAQLDADYLNAIRRGDADESTLDLAKKLAIGVITRIPFGEFLAFMQRNIATVGSAA